MKAAQEVFFGELVNIAADGLRRDIQPPRQFFNRHKAIGTDEFQDIFVTGQTVHSGVAIRAKQAGSLAWKP